MKVRYKRKNQIVIANRKRITNFIGKISRSPILIGIFNQSPGLYIVKYGMINDDGYTWYKGEYHETTLRAAKHRAQKNLMPIVGWYRKHASITG